jgi:hypothetical protein
MSGKPIHASPSAQDLDALHWDDFVGAQNSEAFCRAWLALVCGRIPSVRAAAVLVETADGQSFAPVAVWPEPAPQLGYLAGIVERALREARGVVQPVAAKPPPSTHLAYPIFVGQRVTCVVALDTGCSGDEVQAALRRIHWGSAWLSNLLAKRELETALDARERMGAVLETVAVALRHGQFRQALFEMANDLRRRLACSRVAVGLAKDMAVTVAALSEAAAVENNTPLVKAYAAAMEEAFDAGKAVHACSNSPDPVACSRHRDLLACSAASEAVSCPLIQGARCVGVVTLERTGEGFSAADRAWLDAFAALLAPIVEQRLAAERGSLARLGGEAKAVLEKLFGPRHVVWKAATAALFLIVAMLVLTPLEYRVAAKTVIEGEVQRVAAAPFEGFIAAASARAGDTVGQGQILARLDDRDLQVEQARWASERDQYGDKLREAMAGHDLTSVQVIGAQLREAEAQLALVTEKIARAQLTAPYDGIVVSGDLSQKIGAPVQTGEKLFEIAPLESYRVILQVDEREIRHVRAGQAGHTLITGIAGDPLPLTVAKVTPVATAEDGRNFFRVEARLAQASERLRPGMEGVGKIEVGRRSLWWILTHGFSEWLTLVLWDWLP